MSRYKKELFREMMNPGSAGAGPLKEWTRRMREKEERIFELMGKDAADRLKSGSAPPTYEDRLNEKIRDGLWVSAAGS